MKSVTIIISHHNSLPFLRACVRQILKYNIPEIKTKIIICDQSDYDDVFIPLKYEYASNNDITVVWTQPLYSGGGLDAIFRLMNIDTDYVCELHSDVVPINFSWLKLPITLIEEYDLAFVGQLQCINKDSSIYPPNAFFAMAQCYNVGKTETYKELSLKAGFTRFHNRPQSGFLFENEDWAAWASEDYNARGSDDNIVAFSWQDRYKQDDKLGLAITGYIEPSFGRIIESVLFHFGSANEAKNNMGAMPELYKYYTKRINENYDDALIDEMVSLAKQNTPPKSKILSRNYWDGKTKTHHPTSDEMNKRIEQLKK